MKVRLSPEALSDLRQIQDFLLAEHPALADRVRLAINSALAVLARRPEIGPPNPRVPGARSKLIARVQYRIHYRVEGNTLEVLHIRHTARQPWPGSGE